MYYIDIILCFLIQPIIDLMVYSMICIALWPHLHAAYHALATHTYTYLSINYTYDDCHDIKAVRSTTRANVTLQYSLGRPVWDRGHAMEVAY